jgi:hypothetical protein
MFIFAIKEKNSFQTRPRVSSNEKKENGNEKKSRKNNDVVLLFAVRYT